MSHAGELGWHDCSTFTVMTGSRGASWQQAEAVPKEQSEASRWRTLAEWQLGSEVGRRFAAINGGEVATSHYALWLSIVSFDTGPATQHDMPVTC